MPLDPLRPFNLVCASNNLDEEIHDGPNRRRAFQIAMHHKPYFAGKAFAIKRQSLKSLISAAKKTRQSSDSYTGTSGSVMAGDIATEAIRLGWQHPFVLPVLA